MYPVPAVSIPSSHTSLLHAHHPHARTHHAHARTHHTRAHHTQELSDGMTVAIAEAVAGNKVNDYPDSKIGGAC